MDMEDMDGLVNELFEKVSRMSKKSDREKEAVVVGVLSADEVDEWQSMKVACLNLIKKKEEIEFEESFIRSRSNVFWCKVRRNHGVVHTNSITIDDTDGVLILKKTICKGANCNGECGSCK